MEKHTAGLIIIGDEILRGEIEDKNTSYVAKSLKAVGIRLRKVIVVPDVVNEIAEEVRIASRKYCVVFTAGGVGPTHDDVTYSAIAKALGLKLEENEKLVEIYEKLFPGQQQAKRLAQVPNPCEVVSVNSPASESSRPLATYPVIKVANIYVLPGSPAYFSQAIDAIVPSLERGAPSHTRFIDINLEELEFVDILDEFAKLWGGKVTIGSYPQPGRRSLTRITMEGDIEDVKTAENDLRSVITPRELIRSKHFTVSHAREVLKSSETQSHIKIAIDIIQRCYNEYPNGVFMNFNGGKDCTAVLHLLATVWKINGDSPPPCLYISDDPFPEVEAFVSNAENFYSIELVRKTGTIKSALESLLNDRNNLKIGIMGMRRGDPGSDKLESFSPTDNGWPSITRVNPILDWTYTNVWQFLLRHKVSYCSLYDQGYTSLGKKSTTKPNPLLKDPDNQNTYLPAYELTDSSVERQGRG